MHIFFKSSKKYILLLFSFLAVAGGLFLFHRAQQTIPVIRFSEIQEDAEDSSQTASQTEIFQNPYADLSVPTFLTKIGTDYFIVDCYHDQIIYSDSLDRPLYEWNVMTDQIHKGHTLVSDGCVYLADDTEENRILIFEKKEGRYVHTQTFSDIGVRPHYLVYHEKQKCFYAWSSMSGEMYLFRREEDSNRVYLSEIKSIPALNGIYVRSFTIIGDEIYFVSGNSSILRADLADFTILQEYPVPDEIAGMIQLTPIDGYYYITVSTDKAGSQDAATILRTRRLEDLAHADYEDVYSNFIGGGTPYYITSFDDRFYLTEHRVPGHSIWSFLSKNGQLTDITALY